MAAITDPERWNLKSKSLRPEAANFHQDPKELGDYVEKNLGALLEHRALCSKHEPKVSWTHLEPVTGRMNKGSRVGVDDDAGCGCNAELAIHNITDGVVSTHLLRSIRNMYAPGPEPYNKHGQEERHPIPVPVPPASGHPTSFMSQHYPSPNAPPYMNVQSHGALGGWSSGLCHCCDDPANCKNLLTFAFICLRRELTQPVGLCFVVGGLDNGSSLGG
ncbi:hypothetical protein ACLOJK_013697 [Asimina triloba]